MIIIPLQIMQRFSLRLGLCAVPSVIALSLLGCSDREIALRDSSQFGASGQTLTGDVALSIVSEFTAAIGDEGDGTVNEQARIWMDGKGRYLVTSPQSRGIIKVFDHDGRYLRTFGVNGSGPGEYAGPVGFTQDAPGLFTVFDAFQMRATQLTDNFEVVNTTLTQTPPQGGAYVRLGDGKLFAAFVSRDMRLFGYPLHLLSPDGTKIIRSFGEEPDEEIRYGNTLSLARVISQVAPDGTVWSAPVNRYLLQQWNQGGELVSTIERSVDWFPPWESQGIAREVRPKPVVVAVDQDVEGRLWIYLQVADLNWQPMPPARTTPGGHTYTSDAQRNALFDTMVEVIDPASQEVLASARLEESPIGLAAPGILYSYTEDEFGHPRYILRRVRLVSAN